jgi:hypothetical protein
MNDPIELEAPISLRKLMKEIDGLCNDLELEYIPSKIMISTDYGTKIVVWYDNEKK